MVDRHNVDITPVIGLDRTVRYDVSCTCGKVHSVSSTVHTAKVLGFWHLATFGWIDHDAGDGT